MSSQVPDGSMKDTKPLFTTSCLDIYPGTNEACEQISDENDTALLDDFFASLSPEEMQTIADNVDQAQAFLEEMAGSLEAAKERTSFLAYDRSAGVTAGYAAILRPESETPEIQIEFLEAYQHRGLAYELLQAPLPLWSASHPVQHYSWRASPNHTASIHLAERLGGTLQEPPNTVERILVRNYIIPTTRKEEVST